MRTVAVLPVKTFACAKRRLSGRLGSPQRAALAAAMVADVLAALRDVAGLDDVIVVSGEPGMRAQAAEIGARLVADEPETSHSQAAAIGLQAALTLGAMRVLLLPGDCPALMARELDALLSIRGAGLVVVPDRDGTGTNGLLLHPPDAIVPSFGPGSCARHVELANAAGVPVEVISVESLSLDLDTPEDLEVVSALLEDKPTRAPRTAALLRSLAHTIAA